MGIRDLATRHTRMILNSQRGAGWPFTITDPSGNTGTLTGWSNDISAVIDPDTGQAVSGRLATVSLHVDDMVEAGLDPIPKGENFSTSRPWVIEVSNVLGDPPAKFKISRADPDRTVGCVNCMLEAYSNGG